MFGLESLMLGSNGLILEASSLTLGANGLTQGFSIYQMLWFFLVYAFLGWCTEVVYAAVTTGEFVNRGFLNGPLCPIYGFGVIGVVYALNPVADQFLLLFIGSVFLTSALEWLTGFVLEKLFQNKWWDYSDKPFNLNGYICLAFSIMWGLACVFVIRIVHPTVETFIDFLPMMVGWGILAVGMILFVSDLTVTVFAVIGLNKRLEQLDLIATRLKYLSDELGENISDYTLNMMEKNEQLRDRVEEYKQDAEFKMEAYRLEAEALLKNRKELLLRSRAVQRRLVKAFPRLTSKRFELELGRIKKEILSRRKSM